MKKLLVGLFALTAMNGAASARMESVIVPSANCHISIYGLNAKGVCMVNRVGLNIYFLFGKNAYRVEKIRNEPGSGLLYMTFHGERPDIRISLVGVDDDPSCWVGPEISICARNEGE